MRKFKDAYREEVNSLPHVHISAETVGDELLHRRMEWRRRKKQLWRTGAAAVLFLLCGVGTATAVSYQRSTIEVTDNGYRTTDQKTVLSSDSDQAAAAAGVASDGVPMEAAEQEKAVRECEVVLQEPVEYTSIERFLQQEDITLALPELSLLGGEPESENVLLFEETNHVMINLHYEDSSFYMSQQDYRDTQGYASATAFCGEAVNERQLVSDQGLAYTVFDIVEEGIMTSTHAVISVNGRELSFDFRGYNQETIENTLKGLDFGDYFKED